MKSLALLATLAVATATVARADDATKVDAKAVYLNTCAPCHGDSGNGKGPAAGSLDPKPRNFKRGFKDFKYGTTLEAVIKTISHGVEDTAMPAWSESLKPEEIEAVAKYVRTLAGAKN